MKTPFTNLASRWNKKAALWLKKEAEDTIESIPSLHIGEDATLREIKKALWRLRVHKAQVCFSIWLLKRARLYRERYLAC